MSLALRFYGSSSSIMRHKSTIKPLLHRWRTTRSKPLRATGPQDEKKTDGYAWGDETTGGEIDSFMIDKRATPN